MQHGDHEGGLGWHMGRRGQVGESRLGLFTFPLRTVFLSLFSFPLLLQHFEVFPFGVLLAGQS